MDKPNSRGGQNWTKLRAKVVKKDEMEKLNGISDLPGLTGLHTLDRVFLKQNIEPNSSGKIKYLIVDAIGRQLFSAKQSRNPLLKGHDFDMKIRDFKETKVIELVRPHNFISNETMKVFAPQGHLIGRIVKTDDLNTPNYDILKSDRQLLYHVKGSAITLRSGGEVEFKVMSVDEPVELIGRISKQWTGLPKEFFPTSENVGVSFPEGAHVDIKAILIATCIFIDSMHYSH